MFVTYKMHNAILQAKTHVNRQKSNYLKFYFSIKSGSLKGIFYEWPVPSNVAWNRTLFQTIPLRYRNLVNNESKGYKSLLIQHQCKYFHQSGCPECPISGCPECQISKIRFFHAMPLFSGTVTSTYVNCFSNSSEVSILQGLLNKNRNFDLFHDPEGEKKPDFGNLTFWAP